MILMLLVLLQAADGDAVAAAIAKTRSADRYAFKIETTILGDNAQSVIAEGRYQKDQPAFLKSGETEVYRKGESMAVLKKDVWKKADGRDSSSRRTRGAFTLAGLRALRLPHEELVGIEKRFSVIKKLDAKEGDQDVYMGELTETAAQELYDAHTERKAEVPPSGTGRFWITPAGEVAMIELIVRTKAKSRNRDAGVSMWITLNELGSAKVDVPEAAAKALEEK